MKAEIIIAKKFRVLEINVFKYHVYVNLCDLIFLLYSFDAENNLTVVRSSGILDIRFLINNDTYSGQLDFTLPVTVSFFFNCSRL